MTLTAAQLAAALRVGDSAEETAEVERLLAFATAAVTKYAPAAPDTIQNEAAIRVAGYLFDQPLASRRDSHANALRSSGAAAILAPYRAHSIGVATSTGTGTTDTPSDPGGAGVDATARAAAAQAQATADAAQGTANTAQATATAAASAAATAQTTAGNAQTAATAASTAAGNAQTTADGAATTAASASTTATANAALLTPPSDDEADTATATTVRGWTAALIRRVVEAIVPSWARAANPPTGSGVTFGTGAGEVKTWAEGDSAEEIPLDDIGTSKRTAIPVRFADEYGALPTASDFEGTGTSGQWLEAPDLTGQGELAIWVGTTDLSAIRDIQQGGTSIFEPSSVWGSRRQGAALTVGGVAGMFWESTLTELAFLTGAAYRVTLTTETLADYVEHEIRDNVSHWAETDNPDPIPADKLTNATATVTINRYSVLFPASSYMHREGTALYFADGESIWLAPYPAGLTLAGATGAFKTAVLQADNHHAGIANVGVPANEATSTELWGTHTEGGSTGFRFVFGSDGITLAVPSDNELPTNARDGWRCRLTVVS